MEVIYLSQENRFNIRVSDEACDRLPAGAFNPTIPAPVYVMRFEGEGLEMRSFFLVPGADGTFHWLAMEETRLARR